MGSGKGDTNKTYDDVWVAKDKWIDLEFEMSGLQRKANEDDPLGQAGYATVRAMREAAAKKVVIANAALDRAMGTAKAALESSVVNPKQATLEAAEKAVNAVETAAVAKGWAKAIADHLMYSSGLILPSMRCWRRERR